MQIKKEKMLTSSSVTHTGALRFIFYFSINEVDERLIRDSGQPKSRVVGIET